MPGKSPARHALTDQLRDIIERRVNRGETPYSVATSAGIAPSVLSRFLSRERGLSSESFDRLAEALGLELRETRRGRPLRTPG